MFRQSAPFPAIASLLSILGLSYASSSTASDNVFTSNPTSNTTGVPVWRVGDTVTVTWNTSLSSVNIGYVHSITQDTFYTIYRPDDVSLHSYNWTVDVNASTWSIGSTTMYLGIQDASTGKSNTPFFSTPFTVLPASAPAPTVAPGNNTQAASEQPAEHTSVPLAEIVAPAVVGALLLGGVLTLAAVLCVRRRRQKKRRNLAEGGIVAWQGHQKRPSASTLLTEDGKPRDETRAKKVQWMDEDDEKAKRFKDKAIPMTPTNASTLVTPSAAPITDYQVSLIGSDGDPVSELHGESRLLTGLEQAVSDKEKKARKASIDVQELPGTRGLSDYPTASEPLISSRTAIGSPSNQSTVISPYIRSPEGQTTGQWGVVSPPMANSPWGGDSVVADEETGQFYRIISPVSARERDRGRYQHF